MVRSARTSVCAGVAALLIFASTLARGEPAPPSRFPANFEGAWGERDGQALVRFEGNRMITHVDGNLTVRGLVSLSGSKAVLRRSGLAEVWEVSVSRRGKTLHLKDDGGTREYTRRAEIPAELSLAPFQLGEPKDLPAERIQAIQTELAMRMSRDQAVRKNTEEKPEMQTVDSDNLRYLRDLVANVGWLDVRRFGMKSSCNAALIAKHNSDVRLMLAALPFIERDLKNSPDGVQVYSVFYDGLQIALGGKQRYGTQIGLNGAGNPVLLPLESREGADEARRAIGLSSLSEYLDLASRYLYQGKRIIVTDGETVEPPAPALRTVREGTARRSDR